MGYAEIATAFEAERDLYETLAEHAAGRLQKALKDAGVYTMPVTGRAKDVESFALKAVIGDRYEDPMAEITDKAGVRAVTIYERDNDEVVKIAETQFDVFNVERKVDALDYRENGYLGVHLDARLNQESIDELGDEYRALVFEIQIRTMAQSAWAEVSHAQLYKPPADVPDHLKRRIYRLVALAEIIDSEVEAFLDAAEDTPGYREAHLVAGYTATLAGLGNTRRSHRLLTLELAAAVVPLYGEDDPRPIADAYLQQEIEGLRNLIEESSALPPAEANPLLAQPELPLILERLRNDRLHLERAWPETVPMQWLQDLAEKWAV